LHVIERKLQYLCGITKKQEKKSSEPFKYM